MMHESIRSFGRLQARFITVFLLLAGASPAAADDNHGRKFYLRYCSACHGESAKGDGVVSHLMRPRPADLTQLAKKAGGKFPFYEVIRIIDGRETIRAHGDPMMPIWGDLFRAQEGASPEAHAIARGKIVLITDYLESIQEK